MSSRRPLPDRSPSERGQALVLIALAFVGLAAFIGLAVDAGILFINVGHLRRAVDAAALAAANQFRESRTLPEMEAAADELVNLNSLNPADARIYICDIITPNDPYYDDPTLCPLSGDPYRKFVRVRASMNVGLAFLPVVGWNTVTLNAEAISEAASIDLVLVIDTSASQAFDLCGDGEDNDEDGAVDDCVSNNPPNPAGPPNMGGSTSESDADQCNANRFIADPNGPGVDAPGAPPDGDREDDCHAFEEVRTASLGLLGRMYFPYDRMAVITYDDTATVAMDLATGDNYTSVFNALQAMQVGADPPCTFGATGDPRGCTNTNTGEGERVGGSQFGAFTREEAVWIVIVLSDGAANAARDSVNAWICPGVVGGTTWVSPFCRDEDFEVGNGSAGYDAEDDAEYWAGWVGCPDANTSPQPVACAPYAPGGQGAVIFTIGLGDLVVDSHSCDPVVYAPGYPTGCQPDAGERLLRYIAGAGDDGDPQTPIAQDPCNGVPTGNSCGNYYFAPTGSALNQVFEAIASRIFTRLTH